MNMIFSMGTVRQFLHENAVGGRRWPERQKHNAYDECNELDRGSIMRRKEQEVGEPGALEEILRSCLVCRVAMRDEDGIYIVPVNFGYERRGNAFWLYFHGAQQGKKADLLCKGGVPVGFELDCGHGLIEAELPCKHGFHYASIVGKGVADLLTDPEEKEHALNCIMVRQTGRRFAFDQTKLDGVAVFQIAVRQMTGKRSR